MGVSPKMSNKNGFASLCYVNFIVKAKYRVDSIAQKWGISTDYLYKKIRGEKPWYVDDVQKLYKATGDIEYLEYVNDPCGFTLIPKIKDKQSLKVLGQMISVVQSALNGKDDDK